MTSPPTRALIVGAGDLGLGLASGLAAQGLTVHTLNRSGRRISAATPIVADLADPASLRALPVVDLVIFTTAPPGRTEADYALAYNDGPARLMAALSGDPARVVLVSTSGVIGTSDGSWVDESTDTVPTRATAEIVLRGEQWLQARYPTVAVRPSGIYGAGRRSLIDTVRRGEAPVARDHTIRWTNRVHRDDVVAALATIATVAVAPPVVLVSDDEPTPKDDVIRFLAAALDAPAPPNIDVNAVAGKRCRNMLLRSLGWRPEYPTYRQGYAAALAATNEATTPDADPPEAPGVPAR